MADQLKETRYLLHVVIFLQFGIEKNKFQPQLNRILDEELEIASEIEIKFKSAVKKKCDEIAFVDGLDSNSLFVCSVSNKFDLVTQNLPGNMENFQKYPFFTALLV